jgi:hypothetical protein
VRLKKYNDFINESFGTSKEYQYFLTSKAISLDIFYDSLFDVKQFATVKAFRYLVDSEGKTVNTDVDDKKKYRMLYVCQIQYNLVPGKNNFNKIVDNLNTIKISIEEMIDRVESEGLKLEDNQYWIDKTTGHERINQSFSISFLGDEINTQELKKSFDEYGKFNDKEYLDGLRILRDFYIREDIDFDKHMDTQEDGNHIIIGFVLESVETGDIDIYGIGYYNRAIKRFTINEEEIKRSIEAYRLEN